jgi:hypothetical protein
MTSSKVDGKEVKENKHLHFTLFRICTLKINSLLSCKWGVKKGLSEKSEQQYDV